MGSVGASALATIRSCCTWLIFLCLVSSTVCQGRTTSPDDQLRLACRSWDVGAGLLLFFTVVDDDVVVVDSRLCCEYMDEGGKCNRIVTGSRHLPNLANSTPSLDSTDN